ncbi:MAG TPA: hypothetical protein VNX18_18630 [Bryobacteraceae bacterium]|jgi:hypothetical protein|nr:hypothetical protein [Bryobacteraceae bacterium]
MDYIIANNAKLFDELLAVLSRHIDEPGVEEALVDLNAAKENYLQRSLDHMFNSLVLALYDLSGHPANSALRGELNAVISNYVRQILDTPARLRRLAEEYEQSGGKPLSTEEILREVEERRGVNR